MAHDPLMGWALKPFLLGGWLLLGLIYALSLFWLRRHSPEERPFSWKHPFLFVLAALSSLLLVSSPIDALGQSWLFTVRMFEYICLIYASGTLLLLSLPADLLKACSRGPLRHLLLPFSDLAKNSVLFNGYFLLWHLPEMLSLALQSAWINELQMLSFVISGALMWLPLISPDPDLRLPLPRQMFYIAMLILWQIPVFALLTISPDQLYANYQDQPGMYYLTAYGDQQVSGWFLKIVTLHIFAINFIVIFLQWNRSQRQQDKDDNALAVENFQLVQRAPQRKG